MSKIIVDKNIMTGAADAVRAINGSNDTFKVSELPAQIAALASVMNVKKLASNVYASAQTADKQISIDTSKLTAGKSYLMLVNVHPDTVPDAGYSVGGFSLFQFKPDTAASFSNNLIRCVRKMLSDGTVQHSMNATYGHIWYPSAYSSSNVLTLSYYNRSSYGNLCFSYRADVYALELNA